MRRFILGFVFAATATTSCGGGDGAGTGPANTPAAVANVAVTSAASVVFVGNTLALTAILRDAAGVVLTGRVVLWSSSEFKSEHLAGWSRYRRCRRIRNDPRRATGSQVSAPATGTIFSGLRNPVDFATPCPADDPAFAQIRGDFTLLSDGVPSTATITCTDPYSPMSPMSEELME